MKKALLQRVFRLTRLYCSWYSVVVLAFIARVAVFVSLVYPQDDWAGIGGGDGHGYLSLAEALLANASLDAPLFLVRPPFYPLVVAVLYSVTGFQHPGVVIAFNLTVSALLPGLVFLVARELGLNQCTAFLAGILTAVEPSQAFYGATTLSDSLHAALLVASLLAALKVSSWPRHGVRSFIGAMGVGGTAVAAMLTRPVSLFFWVIPAGLLAARRKGLASVVVVLLGLIALAGWTYHNYAVFGIPAYSTAGLWNAVFIRGTSVVRRVTGEPPAVVASWLAAKVEHVAGTSSEALNRLGFPLTTEQLRDRYLVYTTPERYAAMARVAMWIWKTYPDWSVVMTGIGLLRMYFRPPPILPAPAVWISFYVIVWLLAIWGTVKLRQAGYELVWMLIGLTCFYFTSVTVLLMTAAVDTRFALPVYPFIAIPASWAVCDSVWEKRPV